jgi:hypothetical protein
LSDAEPPIVTNGSLVAQAPEAVGIVILSTGSRVSLRLAGEGDSSREPDDSPAAPPVDSPDPPVDSPDPPVDSPDPPVDSPDPPVDSPDPPVDSPDPPVDSPDPPVDSPDPPVEPDDSFDVPPGAPIVQVKDLATASAPSLAVAVTT